MQLQEKNHFLLEVLHCASVGFFFYTNQTLFLPIIYCAFVRGLLGHSFQSSSVPSRTAACAVRPVCASLAPRAGFEGCGCVVPSTLPQAPASETAPVQACSVLPCGAVWLSGSSEVINA